MPSLVSLLRHNPNCRNLWLGQVVSEVGDHFNSLAVLHLALHLTGSGVAVGGVMLSRMIPAIAAGPLSAVILDRMDRRKVMIASDLFRAVVAAGFIFSVAAPRQWMIYALSGLLMFASPFFTAGRAAILPRITSPEELHTANALTQTTSWLTLSLGTLLGGFSTTAFGYQWAFVANAASFLFSAWAIASLRSRDGSFRPIREGVRLADTERRFWGDFAEGLSYMRRTPLVMGIGLAWVGWASGGGAAQILFTLYGELVFRMGPAGIGIIWSAAGVGLVAGGLLAHRLGPRLGFRGYKHAIALLFLVHGLAYVMFAGAPTVVLSSVWVAISRVGMGANNVLNRTMLLRFVPDHFRGRVFATTEMMMNATMMLSITLASLATGHYPVRTIGFVAGLLSTSTAFFWAWANLAGRLPKPDGVEIEGKSA